MIYYYAMLETAVSRQTINADRKQFVMIQANANQPHMPQTIDYSQPLTRSVLQAMPKIDLHRHLEGSLRLESLWAIAREFKLDLPTQSLEALRPLVQVTDDPPD
ncbi:MAG: hypothetical protein ACE5FD_13055, partial [Anaerolineae bacterium]